MNSTNKKKLDHLDAQIEEAKRQLREIPIEKWENINFMDHPDLDEASQAFFFVAKMHVLREHRTKEREKKLASKMETPAMVVVEREFKEATEFLLKLHPETQQAALSILASNVEEYRASEDREHGK